MGEAKQEQERVTCECGKCEAMLYVEWVGEMGTPVAYADTIVWVRPYGAGSEIMTPDSDELWYCADCPTRLSFDAKGRPVATPMVPKAAVEWLATELSDTCFCGALDVDERHESIAKLVAQALAAAEEAAKNV